MAKIYQNLTELIGNTPLLKLQHLSQTHKAKANIIAKLEFFNPGGSVKDRIALAMIEDAEQKGILRPGSVIIEPTSGNTGVGLAWVASVKGYKAVLTMPETMSLERQNLLKAMGAELVLTPGNEGMSGAIKKAEELRDNTPGAVILQQFENPANPRAHSLTTAKEIWQDTDGKVDVFIAGVGTGGTLSGVGEGLKSYNPNIEIVAVEPDSSAVLSGEKPGMHKIQGRSRIYPQHLQHTSSRQDNKSQGRRCHPNRKRTFPPRGTFGRYFFGSCNICSTTTFSNARI